MRGDAHAGSNSLMSEPPPPPVPEPGGYVRPTDTKRQRTLQTVLAEVDLFSDQSRKRSQLLKQIEQHVAKGTSDKCAVISAIASEKFGGSIDSDDIPAFGDVLMSVGDVDVLYLIIHSPGGDGPVAEKIIELCRAYCEQFRVIIPNRAKSAATIIALGADEIVMGTYSELGPIDAQVLVSSGGFPRYISAQSFIDARNTLRQQFLDRVSKNPTAEVRDILTEIASLDSAFIDHCEKLMDFSRDVARKNLAEHMFSEVDDATQREGIIDNVLKELSSPEQFKIHARMINAHTAKTTLGLNVRILPKDDPLWSLIWQYYIRADVFLSGRYGIRCSRLLESREESLFMPATGLLEAE